MSATVYDGWTGVPSKVVVQPEEAELQLTTGTIFDIHGNPQQVTQTDAHGATRVHRTTWDAEGTFATDQTDPMNQVSYVIYDVGSGVLRATVDPAGLTSVHGYDGFYRPVGHEVRSLPLAANDGAPVVIDYMVDEANVPPSTPGGPVSRVAMSVRTSVTNGQTTTERLSPSGHLVERRWFGMAEIPSGVPNQIPAGTQVYERREYDLWGRVVARSVPQWLGMDPPGWKRRSYDPLGRVVSTNAADGTNLTFNTYLHRSDRRRLRTVVHTKQGAVYRTRSIDTDTHGLPDLVVDELSGRRLRVDGRSMISTTFSRESMAVQMISTISSPSSDQFIIASSIHSGETTSE